MGTKSSRSPLDEVQRTIPRPGDVWWDPWHVIIAICGSWANLANWSTSMWKLIYGVTLACSTEHYATLLQPCQCPAGLTALVKRSSIHPETSPRCQRSEEGNEILMSPLAVEEDQEREHTLDACVHFGARFPPLCYCRFWGGDPLTKLGSSIKHQCAKAIYKLANSLAKGRKDDKPNALLIQCGFGWEPSHPNSRKQSK